MTITTNRVGHAVALAAEIHRDQVDKAGVPYIFHVLAVRENLLANWPDNWDQWGREDCEIACLLHDAFEDLVPISPGERDRLRQRVRDEFGSKVYDAVDALTKVRGEEYERYLDRVEQNWIARRTKIADLGHNLNAFRLPLGTLTERDFKRWDKYHRALARLTSVERAA